jgi:hypothetical protein
MFPLMITTLNATTTNGNRKSPPRLIPVSTHTASFLSEEAREGAIKALDKYNFDRFSDDMAPVIGHISYLYVRL